MTKTLDIIIVNWNAGAQLRRCLDSIVNTDRTGFKLNNVILIDNASTDGSLQKIDKLSLPLKIIKNKENLGFAKACNIAAQKSTADSLLFLNPDTVLFKTSLAMPLKIFEEQNAGILGIQLVDSDGKMQYASYSEFPTFWRLLGCIIGAHKIALPRATHSRIVDQVMGAFFLTKRSIFEELNGFDERFFMYFEEVDFCYRASQLGYQTYYLAEYAAFHAEGGCTKNIPHKRVLYQVKSRILYAYKHLPILQSTTVALATVLFEPLTRLLFEGGKYARRRLHTLR
ncbi:MAG: glycosyltransferase family 2 protein [Alphaproteobacteria bacterium]